MFTVGGTESTVGGAVFTVGGAKFTVPLIVIYSMTTVHKKKLAKSSKNDQTTKQLTI